MPLFKVAKQKTNENGGFSETIIIGVGDAMIRFIKYAGLGTIFYKIISKWIDNKNEN